MGYSNRHAVKRSLMRICHHLESVQEDIANIHSMFEATGLHYDIIEDSLPVVATMISQAQEILFALEDRI